MHDRTALAGFALSAALFALALPGTAPPQPGCETPREAASRAGHTSVVRCDRALAARELRGPARRLFGLTIDPNCADARTLETLPGIGPARAAAILRERSRRPFRRIEEITRAHGIGPITLARLREMLAVAPGPPQMNSVEFPGCQPAGAQAADSERAR